MGRNSFRGPGNGNLEAALHKRFRLTEDASLKFRAELFNLFNPANLFVPGAVADVRTFLKTAMVFAALAAVDFSAAF